MSLEMPPSWQPPPPPQPAQPPPSPYGTPPGTPPAGYRPAAQQPSWGYGNPAPPSVWPVAVFTALFGIFGGISAGRRASRARAVGVSGGRYWGTFAAILAVNVLISGLALAVLIPVYMNVRESALTKDLESRIVEDSVAATDGTSPAVESADCTRVSLNADDSRSYTCLIGFADGSSRSFTIVVDAQRQWAVQE